MYALCISMPILDQGQGRIATGPVSPVLTGPLFPSPMACLVSPNRANARRTPMECTQRSNMLKHDTRWLRTVQKNLFRVFQQLSVLPSRWLVSQSSSVKGVACEISKWKAAIWVQWAERVDIHVCKTLLSGLGEASFWLKIVSEEIS